MSADVIKCPECGAPIKQTKNYTAQIVEVSSIGGSSETILKGDEVTLICKECGWEKHTRNWREYISP